MIAVDSSSAIAYLRGEDGADIRRMDEAMAARQLRLPPPVLSELLSSSTQSSSLSPFLDRLPLLPLGDGYWERIGHVRAVLHAQRLKARLADAMVAQVCIDLDIPLITRDADFRHFAKWCGLKLAA